MQLHQFIAGPGLVKRQEIKGIVTSDDALQLSQKRCLPKKKAIINLLYMKMAPLNHFRPIFLYRVKLIVENLPRFFAIRRSPDLD